MSAVIPLIGEADVRKRCIRYGVSPNICHLESLGFYNVLRSSAWIWKKSEIRTWNSESYGQFSLPIGASSSDFARVGSSNASKGWLNMCATSAREGFRLVTTSGWLRNAMTRVTSNLCCEMYGSRVPRMYTDGQSGGRATSSWASLSCQCTRHKVNRYPSSSSGRNVLR
jgi:hypothetical protein